MYAYQLEPPQPDTRFHKIKAPRGHVCLAEQRAVNRALEKELKRLGLRFLVNEPVPLPVEGA